MRDFYLTSQDSSSYESEIPVMTIKFYKELTHIFFIIYRLKIIASLFFIKYMPRITNL